MMLAAAAALEPAAAADIIKPSEMSAEPQRIPVAVLAAAPTVDGDPAEWAADGWQRVTVRPAGSITIQRRSKLMRKRSLSARRPAWAS